VTLVTIVGKKITLGAVGCVPTTRRRISNRTNLIVYLVNNVAFRMTVSAVQAARCPVATDSYYVAAVGTGIV